MIYSNLGHSGLKVSQLCLGTMNFGPQTDESTSFQIMDRALELGINFIDTANVYGWKIGEGITEQIVGRWLSQGSKRREQIVLATKVYGKMGDGPNDRRLSAYHIRRACDESLVRLQTDHIDLYQMHHIDRETPWEEILQAMEILVQQGKILYAGSSNFAGIHIAQAQYTAKDRNFMGLISEQSLYNLNARMIELEVIPACQEFGLGLIPWSPLAGGMLGCVVQNEQQVGRRTSNEQLESIEKHRTQLEAFSSFCDNIGETPANIALAWLLHNPIVTAPIIGPRTMAQLEGSIQSLDIKLSEKDLETLDGIWPGPGGRAPEAYAW